jgi:3-hydroxymyristoyl/3-hydroxydecanoyl-(acyl carrier protein) dehydratase
MIDNSLKKTLDKDFVEKLLPQKFPFVMVDKMYDFTETSLVSGFTILEESIFFQDGNFLESGLIEHIAQSIALHTGYQFFLRNEPAPMGYIGSIKDIEILKLPKLGDEIQTTVSILQEFAGITLVDAITKIDDIVIASGQMKTVLAK